jgi:hypothetical protein
VGILASLNEWIGRYACLCALTGKPVADIVMRNIKIGA